MKKDPKYLTEVQRSQLKREIQNDKDLEQKLRTYLGSQSNSAHVKIECIICFQRPEGKIFRCSECDHIFCESCKHQINRCGMCRYKFSGQEPKRARFAERLLNNDRSTEDWNRHKSSKFSDPSCLDLSVLFLWRMYVVRTPYVKRMTTYSAVAWWDNNGSHRLLNNDLPTEDWNLPKMFKHKFYQQEPKLVRFCRKTEMRKSTSHKLKLTLPSAKISYSKEYKK